MAKTKKIFVITHFDLDGAVSYLVTKWFHPGYDIEVLPVSNPKLREELREWCITHKFNDYEQVYILDLDVSKQKDLIDKENVFIIDHHASHAEDKAYENAIACVKSYSSACLLAYKAFSKLNENIKLTNEQKKLIIYADDYDSWKKDFQESSDLDTVFWGTQKSFVSFIENFNRGFYGFTKEQQNMVTIYKKQLADTISNLAIFQGGHADIDGEYRNIIATFLNKSINPNDIADYMIKTYDADMAIVINLSTNRINFRRPPDGTMRVDAFAKEYAVGGGHEDAAGGEITNTFLEFTKTLKQINR